MADYQDCRYQSADGLSLYYRDYGGKEDKPAVLCMAGLTRNSADFADLAQILRPRFRVLCADQRGRGVSDYAADSSSYTPAVYVDDMRRLLDHANVARVTLIGTSLGGLMSMMMAVSFGARIRAIILNDIGPDLDEQGTARILSYVGKAPKYRSWHEAAHAIAVIQSVAFPDYSVKDWLQFARRTCVEKNGLVTTNYDPRIAEPFQAANGEMTPDLWPLFDEACKYPLLCVKGALSDLFTQETLDEMLARCPLMRAVVAHRVGHAPSLVEDDVLPAVQDFLASVHDL